LSGFVTGFRVHTGIPPALAGLRLAIGSAWLSVVPDRTGDGE
jgi:hypothetical protein